jgi:hypothetical protein
MAEVRERWSGRRNISTPFGEEDEEADDAIDDEDDRILSSSSIYDCVLAKEKYILVETPMMRRHRVVDVSISEERL